MPRKAVLEGGRRDEIIEQARKLFFENGYENTSIRMIASQVGCEVGLIYYYFKNKDDAFEKVMDKMFADYGEEFHKIVCSAKRDPFRALQSCFRYVAAETEKFRSCYAENMHWTVRYAIRERAMLAIEPEIRELVTVLCEYGARPNLSIDATAKFFSYGICSAIIHESKETLESSWAEIRKAANLVMGLSEESAELMFPYFGGFGDIEGMKELIRSVADIFPQFDRNEDKLLPARINDRELILIRRKNEIAGAVMFSLARKEIDFLAVKENLRRRGIATRLMITALARFEIGEKVSLRCPESAESFFEHLGFEKKENGMEITVSENIPIK